MEWRLLIQQAGGRKILFSSVGRLISEVNLL
jgi:hypothetical protein